MTFLKEAVVINMIKQFPAYTEPLSEKLATEPYPEPTESSVHFCSTHVLPPATI
jgi:hypothetical protein